jgi:transposase
MWVYLAAKKYLNGEPPNRTLKQLSLSGLPLSAGTVVGGFKVIATLLDPLYEAIVTRCQGADLWNADETTQPVFEDDAGNRNKKRWWIWVIASDDAVVYILDRSRSKEVPSEFFGGSRGVLMTDRLASYKALHDAIKKAWCWVHQRRDFIKIYDGNPRLKSWAKDWMLEITTLFLLNHKRLKLWQENQISGAEWEQAQHAVEQHIQKLKERWEEELQQPDLHKEQKKALRSLQKHWDGLTIFLLDPRIPLDNNRAERLLKGLVINRKNSFGCGKEWAGHMNAKFHTIFQTWLVNGLNPEALLLDYFNECSKTSGRPPPDVSQFLPWTMSEERKQAFQLPKSYKRPA